MVARKYRLREEADVKRVRSRGRAVADGPLVLKYISNTVEPAQNRYTVIAGKRCGKAVQRNRLKRLVREALRGFHPWLAPGHDIIVICRGTVEEMPSLQVAQQVLHRLLTRARLLSPGAPEPGAPVESGWSASRPDPESSPDPAT